MIPKTISLREVLPCAVVVGCGLLAACSANDSARSAEVAATRAAAVTASNGPSQAAKPRLRMRPQIDDGAPAQASRRVAARAVGDGDQDGDDYPAFRPNVPQLVKNGGPHLHHPRVVTITWDGDPERATFEKFGDEIGESSYWRTAVGEYGVREAWSGPRNHVHVKAPLPAPISDADLENWVRAQVVGARSSGWPENTDQTIYTVYLPPGSQLQFGGQDACQSALGYHTDALLDPNATDAGVSQEFNYAIIVRCSDQTIDDLTETAAHEIGEASTDPFPNVSPGLVGFDQDHFAYELFQEFQDEDGDACEFFKTSYYVEKAPFAFGVQRMWSNRSAREGHNPCVPRLSEPFYNVTTFAKDDEAIHVDLSSMGGGSVATKGLKIALNASRTIDLGFFSDAATSGEWTVAATVPANVGFGLGNGQATVTIDQPSGQNGHVAHVTITPTAAGAIGAQYILFTSTLPGLSKHFFPILVGQN